MAKATLSDGRELTLIFDLEAMIAAEGLYGKPAKKLMADAKAGFVGAVRAIMYGALQAKHPDISPAEAGTIWRDNKAAMEAALEEASKAVPAAPPKRARKAAP